MNICLTCGKGCRKYKDQCVVCFKRQWKQQGKTTSCLVCGEETTHENQFCCVECHDRYQRFILVQKDAIGIPAGELSHLCTDMFEGEVLFIWSDDDGVFVSFSYPGVTLFFAHNDAFGAFLRDVVSLSDMVKDNNGPDGVCE
jgi:hypothetical protein